MSLDSLRPPISVNEEMFQIEFVLLSQKQARYVDRTRKKEVPALLQDIYFLLADLLIFQLSRTIQ